MGAISPTQKQALASKLQRLSERVDAEVIDAIFNEIFQQIGDLKSVFCTLGDDDSTLCLQSQDDLVAKVELPRAKAILRLMCARLAVRSSAWAEREVLSHGDHVEFELPESNLLCKVNFENTPDMQRFEIKLRVCVKPVEAPTRFAKAHLQEHPKSR